MEKVLCIMPIYRFPNKYINQSIASLVYQFGVETEIVVMFHGNETDLSSLLDKNLLEKIKIYEYQDDDQELSCVNMINFAIEANRGKYDYFTIVSDDTIFSVDAIYLMLDKMNQSAAKMVIPNIIERVFRVDKYIASNISTIQAPIKNIEIEKVKEINYSVTIPILFDMKLFADTLFNPLFPALFMVDFLKQLGGNVDVINTDAYVFQMSDENLYGFSFDSDKWASVYVSDFKRLKERYR